MGQLTRYDCNRQRRFSSSEKFIMLEEPVKSNASRPLSGFPTARMSPPPYKQTSTVKTGAATHRDFETRKILETGTPQLRCPPQRFCGISRNYFCSPHDHVMYNSPGPAMTMPQKMPPAPHSPRPRSAEKTDLSQVAMPLVFPLTRSYFTDNHHHVLFNERSGNDGLDQLRMNMRQSLESAEKQVHSLVPEDLQSRRPQQQPLIAGRTRKWGFPKEDAENRPRVLFYTPPTQPGVDVPGSRVISQGNKIDQMTLRKIVKRREDRESRADPEPGDGRAAGSVRSNGGLSPQSPQKPNNPLGQWNLPRAKAGLCKSRYSPNGNYDIQNSSVSRHIFG